MVSALTALVLSDLHVTTRTGDKAGSWLTTSTPRNDREHPLYALRSLVRSEQLKLDLILCAGDIADQADPTALDYAWKELNELAHETGARLVATAGNHDLDSRHKADLDPRGSLYDLRPQFPAGDGTWTTDYWAKNYAIVDGPASETGELSWRVVTLNSCAFHGYVSSEGSEYEHGRISKRTILRLEQDLATLAPALINILLVHHHLEQLPSVDLKERSQIRDAEYLIEFLQSAGSWLVVHGHKHRAHVMYAHGPGSSAAIFAAGSLSAYPSGDITAVGARNQVYALHFPSEEDLDKLDLGMAATFQAWNWSTRGWSPAGADSGLPGRGGFGWRLTNCRTVARRIFTALSESRRSMDRDELLTFEPKLRYAAPEDLKALIKEIETRHPVKVSTSDTGELARVRLRITEEPQSEEAAESLPGPTSASVSETASEGKSGD